MRRGVSPAPIERKIDLLHTFTHRFGEGLVATDGVQWTPAVTVGTSAVNIVDEVIDPGIDVNIKRVEVGLTQRFTELLGAVGSLSYHWRVRREPVGGSAGGWFAISPTIAKGIGSLAESEDTFSGYVDTDNLYEAPFRIQLSATALAAASMTGEVKNSSYIKLIGSAIPGA